MSESESEPAVAWPWYQREWWPQMTDRELDYLSSVLDAEGSESAAAAMRLRARGATYEQMAQSLGVTRKRVGDLLFEAERGILAASESYGWGPSGEPSRLRMRIAVRKIAATLARDEVACALGPDPTAQIRELNARVAMLRAGVVTARAEIAESLREIDRLKLRCRSDRRPR